MGQKLIKGRYLLCQTLATSIKKAQNKIKFLPRKLIENEGTATVIISYLTTKEKM